MTTPPDLTLTAVHVQGTGHPQQDRWGSVASTFVWVLDGASRRDPTEWPVLDAWLDRLGEALGAAFRLQPDRDLTDLLAEAVSAARSPRTERGYHPSATVALARFDQDAAAMDWLVLGDAAIVVDGRQHSDRRPGQVGARIRAELAALRADGASEALVAAHRDAAEDAARNQSGGFWVASDDPTAAGEALTGRAAAREVLLVTDGIGDELPAVWNPTTRTRAADLELPELPDLDLSRLVAALRPAVIERDGRADDMTGVLACWP